RFKQIGLQMLGGPLGGRAWGVGAFNYPEIQAALKFTDRQKEALQKLEEKAQKEYEDVQQKVFKKGAAWSGKDHVQTSRRIHKATMEKAFTVLTEGQKKSWKKMTGEPFENKADFEDTDD